MSGDLEEEGCALRDSKFVHLLKPIRDLAENWNVDIANELEEYLTHLDRTGFSFDGGPSLDFAEAALLIQSSACVYSKKVEYLHSLVFQALEAVRSRRKKDVTGDDVDADLGEGLDLPPTQRNARAKCQRNQQDDDDSMEAFLASGLELEQGEDIDLGEECIEGALVYSRQPAALLALEDQGTGQGDGDSGVYRLAQCYVHISGALLLDLKDGEHYDDKLHYTGSVTQPMTMHNALHGTAEQALLAAQLPPQQHIGSDDDDDDGGGGDAGGGNDDNNDDVPHQIHQQLAAPTDVLNPATIVQQQQMEGHHGDAQGPTAAGPAPVQDLEVEEELFDPFKPLDPNDQGVLPTKPLQVRKPAVKNRKVCLAKWSYNKEWTGQPRIPGLFHQEFAYAMDLLPHGSRKSGQRPAAPLKARMEGNDDPAAIRKAEQTVFDWGDATAAAAAVAGGVYSEDDGMDDGMDAGAAWDAAGFGGEDDGIEERGINVADIMAGMHGTMHLGVGTDAGDAEVPSYEDLCRKHIESMLSAAAAREVQTELAVRVTKWRTRIDHVLKTEETRKNFDLQQYGETILSKMVDKEHTTEDQRILDFKAVAGSSLKYEVSRAFAAMLQLINNRNVAISQSSGGPDAPFKLQLLTTIQPHKRMAERLKAGSGKTNGSDEGMENGPEELQQFDGALTEEQPQQEPMLGKRVGIRKPTTKAVVQSSDDGDNLEPSFNIEEENIDVNIPSPGTIMKGKVGGRKAVSRRGAPAAKRSKSKA